MTRFKVDEIKAIIKDGEPHTPNHIRTLEAEIERLDEEILEAEKLLDEFTQVSLPPLTSPALDITCVLGRIERRWNQT